MVSSRPSSKTDSTPFPQSSYIEPTWYCMACLSMDMRLPGGQTVLPICHGQILSLKVMYRMYNFPWMAEMPEPLPRMILGRHCNGSVKDIIYHLMVIFPKEPLEDKTRCQRLAEEEAALSKR